MKRGRRQTFIFDWQLKEDKSCILDSDNFVPTSSKYRSDFIFFFFSSLNFHSFKFLLKVLLPSTGSPEKKILTSKGSFFLPWIEFLKKSLINFIFATPCVTYLFIHTNCCLKLMNSPFCHFSILKHLIWTVKLQQFTFFTQFSRYLLDSSPSFICLKPRSFYLFITLPITFI